MRRVSGIAAVLLLAGVLCVGCSAGASGAEDPNLVVYNDSTAVLGSISVSGENEGQVVSMADGHPLERGESYGFEVKAPGPVWVDIPVNFQGSSIDPDTLPGYDPAADDAQLPPPVAGDTIRQVLEYAGEKQKELERLYNYEAWKKELEEKTAAARPSGPGAHLNQEGLKL